MSKIINATNDNFDTVLKEQGQNGKHVLVDFWAEWCGPCKALSPLLEDYAASQEDVVVVKVNADDNQLIAARYGIRGLPTVKLFAPNTEELATRVGAMQLSQLKSWVEANKD